MTDTFAPDFGQRIDADGRVTVELEGHLTAAGVDLPAGGDAAPPADSRIRWLREDGTVVAGAVAYEIGGVRSVVVYLDGTPTTIAVTDTGINAQVDGESTILATADGPPYVAVENPAQKISVAYRAEFGPPVTLWLDVSIDGNFLGSIQIEEP